ncbi:MAG TPA: sigma-54 dependent transcriptional regulator [Gemmatimonadaceae bacterium]|nr:sigma-54 dependent transcriptional regulator [Gemmatimonadaceae bacterium]
MTTLTQRTGRILIVDDDATFRLTTGALLAADGHHIESAPDGQRAVEQLREQTFDLLLVDLRMPGIDGIGFVEALRLWGHRVPILMISGFGTIDAAVRAMHLGADDFLTKPVEPSVLSERVAELLELRPRTDSVREDNPGGMIGRSAPIRGLFERIELVAPTESTVLITGETGVGKELVARAVHALSPRRNKPMVSINCAALAEGLLESELFGHVRGAFTGAVRDRAGVFEAAHSGTLFLDEIGATTPALQSRLLRALQEREITRVGSTNPIKVDVRIITATNEDLGTLVAEKRMREDLQYRLAVFPLAVPPLRDRPADVPLLVDHWLTQLAKRLPNASELSCSAFALKLLRTYQWPGNVRQLFAALESAAISAGGGRIETHHLPDVVRGADRGTAGRYRAAGPIDDERAAIKHAIERADGSFTRAAELLGMGRTTLWRKMRAHGIASPPSEGAEANA